MTTPPDAFEKPDLPSAAEPTHDGKATATSADGPATALPDQHAASTVTGPLPVIASPAQPESSRTTAGPGTFTILPPVMPMAARDNFDPLLTVRQLPRSETARLTPIPSRMPLPPTDHEATINALSQRRNETAGSILRRARLLRRLALTDVAVATRIRSEYLAAIEDETAGVLPPGRYAISLHRSYAIFLGVPPDDVVRLYTSQQKRRDRFASMFGARVSVQVSRTALGVALFLIGIAIAISAWYFVLRPLSTEPDVASARALAQATFLPGTTATGTPGPGTSPVPSTPIIARTVAPFTPIASNTAPSTPAPATPAPAPIPATETAIPPTAVPPTAIPEPSPRPPSGPRTRSIVLTYAGDSWTRVVVDGKLPFEETVPRGQTRTYEGTTFSVRVGNGGAVSLVAFGEDRGILGVTGQVVDLNLDINEP